jgi:hypothetical protein
MFSRRSAVVIIWARLFKLFLILLIQFAIGLIGEFFFCFFIIIIKKRSLRSPIVIFSFFFLCLPFSSSVAYVPVDGSGLAAHVCIIELGGTVGDIESAPYIEALRQFQFKISKNVRELQKLQFCFFTVQFFYNLYLFVLLLVHGSIARELGTHSWRLRAKDQANATLRSRPQVLFSRLCTLNFFFVVFFFLFVFYSF